MTRLAPVVALLLALVPGAALAQLAPEDPQAPVFLVSSLDTWHRSLGTVAGEPRLQRDALGRAVVVSRARNHQLEALSQRVHAQEGRCGGYFAFPTRAAAQAFVRGDRTAQAMQAQAIAYTIDQHARVDRWMAQVSEPALRGTILHLSTAWPNRYYNSLHGRDSAHWIRELWAEMAAGRDDVTTTLHTSCFQCGVQPSVILTIEGTDLADEIVVMGGHLDSISSTGTGNLMDAPGADDNASGIAVLTEALRIALADGWRPRRTIQLMGYSAEEIGLRGSQAIANQYRYLGKDVVAVLQLDMTNYTTTGTTIDLRIISDYSNAPLQAFVRELFDTYLAPLGHTRGASACGYACSDHASWTQAGFPSVFVAEPVLFPTRHTPSDVMPNIGATANVSVPITQLALAFMAELGKEGVRVHAPPVCRPSVDPDSDHFAGALAPAPKVQSPLPRPRPRPLPFFQ